MKEFNPKYIFSSVAIIETIGKMIGRFLFTFPIIQILNPVPPLIFIGCYIPLYILAKLFGTVNFVEKIKINDDAKVIQIIYRHYYLIRRKVTITFDEFQFKEKIDILKFQGGYTLYIYKNETFMIKVGHLNGWRKKQILALAIEFMKIKLPIPPYITDEVRTLWS